MARAAFKGLGVAALGALTFSGAAHAQAPDVSNLPRFQTNWQDVIKPNAGFWSTGVAQEFAYTAGPGGVTSVAPPSTNLISNVRQVYGAAAVNPPMVYLEIIDGVRTVSFIRAYADTFIAMADDKATFARASDWSRQAVVADPLTLGWQYQSFAAWQTGLGHPNGSMGATSFGNETAWNGTSAVPQTGQATFNGFMGGIFNDAVGQDHAVTADVAIQMNFGAHTAEFATTNTKDRFGASYEDLNITGGFLGLPNYPQMFGSLTTARLQGASSARFFGPAAEEFGGVFTLTPKNGQGLERFAGAFGGRQAAPAPSTRFTSWGAALKPNATIALTGVATGFVPAGGSFGDNGATFTETLDAAGALRTLQIATIIGAVGFSASAGDSIGALAADPRFIATANSTKSQSALIADPTQFGWDYQSFGAWQTMSGAVTYPSGFSGGAATPTTALPPSGEVTFVGAAGASYVRGVNEQTFVTATVRLDTNFANRTAKFQTSDMVSLADGTTFSRTALSADLTWIAGTNQLGGVVRSAGGMSGGVEARFYGPAAQEVGGVFAAGSGSNERISGAFGAKR